MPLDFNSYRLVTPQVAQPEGPLDIMQKVESIRNSRALQQDRAALIQDRQQKAQQEAADRQEQAQMQAVVQQNGGDIAKAYPQLASINAEKADKYLKAHLDTAKLQGELDDYDTQKKVSVAGFVTKNLQDVEATGPDERQHAYDVARANIQFARAQMHLPPATEQDMPAVYNQARVAQMIQNGQMTQDVLGKQAKGEPTFYTLPSDPTPHLMLKTADGRVMWQGKDMREQAQPWEKGTAAGDKPKDMIADTTGGLTGDLGLAAAKYMHDHSLTSVLQIPTPIINQMRRDAKQAITITAPSGAEKRRGVTSGDANKLAEYDSGLNDLSVLKKTVSTEGATGIAAEVGAALPNWVTNATGWGTSAKARQAVIDRVKQVIGKSLEGGVLRKEDEIKYTKILPTIADPPAVVQAKLDGLDAAIRQKKVSHLESLADAGYDTSRYESREAAKPHDTTKKNPFR